MLESAAIIGARGEVLYWHLPHGRSNVALPDSPDLWSSLWQHRLVLSGVAHTHPGRGTPRPSWTDLTTFAACEDGLGERLRWWIATADRLRCFRWSGPSRYRYTPIPTNPAPGWLDQLRAHSHLNKEDAR